MALSSFDFDGGLAYALSSDKQEDLTHGRTNPGSQAPVRRIGQSYGTTTTTYRRKELTNRQIQCCAEPPWKVFFESLNTEQLFMAAVEQP